MISRLPIPPCFERLRLVPGRVARHLVSTQLGRLDHGRTEEPTAVVVVHPHRALVIDQPEVVVDDFDRHRPFSEIKDSGVVPAGTL